MSMFNLLDELNARRKAIADNDENKRVVAELEAQLAEAKAKCRDDEGIRELEADCEKIEQYCYNLGLLERPVVEIAEPEIIADNIVIEEPIA